MELKKRLQRKITINRFELASIIITTLLVTILFITIWPRFRSDAMSVSWYWYILLIIIFFTPLYRRIFGR